MTAWLVLALVVLCVVAAGMHSLKKLSEMTGRENEKTKNARASLRSAQAALDRMAEAPPDRAGLIRRWRARMRGDGPGDGA